MYKDRSLSYLIGVIFLPILAWNLCRTTVSWLPEIQDQVEQKVHPNLTAQALAATKNGLQTTPTEIFPPTETGQISQGPKPSFTFSPTVTLV